MKNKTKKYFIIGCARSATSILGELIQSHPDVKYIFEASSIWETAGAGIGTGRVGAWVAPVTERTTPPGGGVADVLRR